VQISGSTDEDRDEITRNTRSNEVKIFVTKQSIPQPKVPHGVYPRIDYFMHMTRWNENVDTATRRHGDTARQSFRFPAFSLSAFLIASVSVAVANPYTGIVDRNVFSLRPPPPVDNTPQPPPTPPVKLTLTGITTILGNKRALLKAQLPARPGEPAKDESYMLTEGQRADGIEVVTIDEREGKVTVNNNGIAETLDFVNHGAKLVAAAPAPGTPGIIPPPHLPGTVPGSPPNAAAARQIPTTRTLRGQQGAGVQGAAPGQVQPGGNYQHQPIDPDIQTVMMEVERERTKDSVMRGEFPPLPPTVITPEDSPDFIPAPGDSPGVPPIPF
jgi:hypothetical protein